MERGDYGWYVLSRGYNEHHQRLEKYFGGKLPCLLDSKQNPQEFKAFCEAECNAFCEELFLELAIESGRIKNINDYIRAALAIRIRLLNHDNI